MHCLDKLQFYKAQVKTKPKKPQTQWAEVEYNSCAALFQGHASETEHHS